MLYIAQGNSPIDPAQHDENNSPNKNTFRIYLLPVAELRVSFTPWVAEPTVSVTDWAMPLEWLEAVSEPERMLSPTPWVADFCELYGNKSSVNAKIVNSMIRLTQAQRRQQLYRKHLRRCLPPSEWWASGTPELPYRWPGRRKTFFLN